MHQLKTKTSRLPNQNQGEFTIVLVAQTHKVNYRIVENVLTMWIADADQVAPKSSKVQWPLVISATRIPKE